MQRPNLFDFATSELSQDAFIAWLLSWADPAWASTDTELHACGQRLLAGFFRAHGKTAPHPIEKVEVRRQVNHIDVLCIVNAQFAVLVEDKTATQEHGAQLPNYIKALTGRGFERERILPIYLKTHEQSDFTGVTKHAYQVFTRRQVLDVLETCQSSNNILLDFRQRMLRLESDFGSHRTLPLSSWDYRSWIGFYQELKRVLTVESTWEYVPNPGGGFWGFWWCWPYDADERCHVYLQLEQAKFCFRVSEVQNPDRAATRNKWHRLIVNNASQHGFRAVKPKQFGYGKSMTVAVLDGEYRKLGSDGLLDFDQTVDFIKQVQAGFTRIVSQSTNVIPSVEVPATG